MVVEAREWCNESTSDRFDPVNPEGGASLRGMLTNNLSLLLPAFHAYIVPFLDMVPLPDYFWHARI